MSQRKLSEAVKKKIAGKQFFKCANSPNAQLNGLTNYSCPLWINPDIKFKGNFDEAGYEIDHIVEYSLTQDDSENNLQALCRMCHMVKTKRFLTNPKKDVTHVKNIKKDTKRINHGDECERCHKIFYNKSHFNDHLNRKILCLIVDKIDNSETDNKIYCEKCDKYFSRPCALKRHRLLVCEKQCATINTNINTNTNANVKTDKGDINQVINANATTDKGDINQVINTGNNNKITIKQYNLFPFGKDGLTVDDVDKQIKNRKVHERRIKINKELALFLLDLSLRQMTIDGNNYLMIKCDINDSNDLDYLLGINNVLTGSAYFGLKINNKIIRNKINNVNELVCFEI